MTTVQQIRKRDGRVVPFHENKIADAINKAFEATYKPGYEETAAKLAHEVASVLEVEGGNCPDVEHIQDIVERVLMDNGYVQTAKAYILYRSERNRAREMNTRLMKIYEDITFSSAKDSDIKRENANIDGDTAMGVMLKYGCEGAKDYYEKYLLTPEQAAEIIQSRCYQMLCQIRAALDEPNMNDAACFQRIEEIVEIIEQYGSDGGCRHDY